MLTKVLTALFERDLKRLKSEISEYGNESDLWLVDKGIKNSAGNLCLHIAGNLQHYIGATLGNTGYVRNRDGEFSRKDVPKDELLQLIDMTSEVITETLAQLTEDQLAVKYPIKVMDQEITTATFLIHLQGHLNYHLGQINYHRRLLAS